MPLKGIYNCTVTDRFFSSEYSDVEIIITLTLCQLFGEKGSPY